MTYEPKRLKRWIMPGSYFGAEWPDYFSSGVGQSRDSDPLETSNFRVMLKLIGGESETVKVIREGHWAVGWVEWIAIHQDDEKALSIADEQAERLQDYLILDEDDWSEEEQKVADETWTNCYDDKERVKYIRENRSQFEFRDYGDLIGCVRGRYFAGYAGDLLS